MSKLKDRAVEFIQLEEQNEKRLKKSVDSLRDLWDTIKWINICVIWIPEGEEREKGQKASSKK